MSIFNEPFIILMIGLIIFISIFLYKEDKNEFLSGAVFFVLMYLIFSR